jgi:hypothetical protein
MKKFQIYCIVSVLSLFAINTMASETISSKCYKNAKRYVEKFAGIGRYDENGFSTYQCATATNKKAVICYVSASKGDGAAIDSYRAVMNRTCSRSFRVELSSEE